MTKSPKSTDAAVTEANWPRQVLRYAILFGLAWAGIAMKTPFGLLLYHALGKAPPTGHGSPIELLTGAAGALAIVVLGSALHRRSGLPAAPWLDRLLFRVARATPGPRIWRPGLLGALASLAIFILSQAIQGFWGASNPLAAKVGAGQIAPADMTELVLFWPLATIGAGLSEEIVYRFGVMSILMGLMSFVRRRRATDPSNAAFWIANVLQAAWFGFGHVQQGLLAARTGGLAFATFVAPQTWSALVFGYVYRRWGLEAAIIAHTLSDLLAPLCLAGLTQLHHH